MSNCTKYNVKLNLQNNFLVYLDPFDDWSSWSGWGECFPSCDIIGSTQTRHRSCLGNRCFGEDTEKRDCLNCSPQLKSNWSCWTEWSECSSCSSFISKSTKYRTRMCLAHSCEGIQHEERSCLCPLLLEYFNEYRFTLLQVILISLISFSFGGLLLMCIYGLCCHQYQHKDVLHQKDDRDYFPESTPKSSSSPHTAMDSDTFTVLSNGNQNKFRSFDSSSLSRTGTNKYSNEIPSKTFNMYINPRDISPLSLMPTSKRASLLSSMKTNLDAEDI